MSVRPSEHFLDMIETQLTIVFKCWNISMPLPSLPHHIVSYPRSVPLLLQNRSSSLCLFYFYFYEITCTKLSTSRYNKYIFIHKQNISLEVKISDEPVCSSFGWLVRSDGRFVCRSVFPNSLPCSHLITCYFHTLYNKTTQLLS